MWCLTSELAELRGWACGAHDTRSCGSSFRGDGHAGKEDIRANSGHNEIYALCASVQYKLMVQGEICCKNRAIVQRGCACTIYRWSVGRIKV